MSARRSGDCSPAAACRGCWSGRIFQRKQSQSLKGATMSKKIAWITGGGTGIGLGGAKELAKEGWTVIVSGRRADVLEQAAKQAGPSASALVLDVADKADVERAAKTIIDQHGRIDLLVN